MSTKPVVVVNTDPALQANLEQRLADTAHDLVLSPTAADAPAVISESHPTAIVVNLPCDASPEHEQSLLEHLCEDAESRETPVVLSSERPAVLQSAMSQLRSRPGGVQASIPDAEEIAVKVDVAEKNRR
jgi:DNA-binding NtrC family response regulator